MKDRSLDHIRCARCGTRVTAQAPRCGECGADPRTGVATFKRGEMDRVRVCQGVWARGFALGADALILFGAWLLISLVYYLVLAGSGKFAVMGQGPGSGPLWALAAAGSLLYFWLCVAVWGRTLGMRLVGLRVVAADGRRLGSGAALLRAVLLVVDWLPLCFVLGAVIMWATPRNQRLGDLAARSVVVHAELVSLSRLAHGGPPVVPWSAGPAQRQD